MKFFFVNLTYLSLMGPVKDQEWRVPAPKPLQRRSCTQIWSSWQEKKRTSHVRVPEIWTFFGCIDPAWGVYLRVRVSYTRQEHSAFILRYRTCQRKLFIKRPCKVSSYTQYACNPYLHDKGTGIGIKTCSTTSQTWRNAYTLPSSFRAHARELAFWEYVSFPD